MRWVALLLTLLLHDTDGATADAFGQRELWLLDTGVVWCP